MWPDRVSNPGPLTYESGALPTALRVPAARVLSMPLRVRSKVLTVWSYDFYDRITVTTCDKYSLVQNVVLILLLYHYYNYHYYNYYYVHQFIMIINLLP